MEIQEQQQDQPLQDLKAPLLELKKRTFQTFLGQIEEELGTNSSIQDQIVKEKFELKYNTLYKDIGERKVPGVLVDETKRRKILEELGVQMRDTSQKNKKSVVEEEEKQLMPASSEQTEQMVKRQAEKEKTGVLSMIPDKYKQSGEGKVMSSALSLVNAMATNQTSIAIRHKKVVHPQWHAPWKLKRVISGHNGWVRCLAVDPMNKFFVSGSNDRTIKFWDLVDGTLKVTLTGHINTVRGLALSSRHPYLFSCGEDKKVLCWDLEQNKVVRHYHGHLSGIYTMALHPELDVLVTGGRDATARVWDMRTKAQIHCLGGHSNTVEAILCQGDEPQIITGSHDKTIRMWDIRTGGTIKTLTHHKKGVRALALHHDEYSFASAGSDKIRVWKCPEGDQLRTIPEHNAVVNSLALNRDNVLVSGADNGSLQFFDWQSGHNFQQIKTQVQPGSLSCEAGIFDIKFDRSSLRMITAECDKSIKIYKEDETATPETHPLIFGQE